MTSPPLVGYANLSPIFAPQYDSTDSNLSSASIRDLVEQKRQKSDDAVEVMKQVRTSMARFPAFYIHIAQHCGGGEYAYSKPYMVSLEL
jgi:hypothetical protein